MTTPIGFPIRTRHTFEIIATDGAQGGIRRRQRFPWASPFKSWTVEFGPDTYANIETDVLATIRTAKGGAALVTGYIPGIGSVTGFFGDDIVWRNDSPTAHYITVSFHSEASNAV